MSDAETKTGQAMENDTAVNAPCNITKSKKSPAQHRIYERRTPKPSSFNTSTTTTTRKKAIKTLPRMKQSDPRKIKIGEAKIFRDFLFLIGFIGIALFITSGWDYKKKDKNVPKTTKQIVSDLVREVARKSFNRKRSDPCAIFLHSGSIPGTGLSFFAGRNFSKGDLLLDASQQLLPLNRSITVPSYALLLKHHPFLANADGPLFAFTDRATKESSYRLFATQSIGVGDEIFVPYTPALHDNPLIFDHIPSLMDYQIASEITTDMIKTSHAKEHTINLPSVAMLLKRSIAKMNPRVAALLPRYSKVSTTTNFKDASYFSLLQNHTISDLQDMGSCVSEFVMAKSSSIDNDTSWKAKHKVQKGDVIITIPIGFVPLPTAIDSCSGQQQDNECSLPLYKCYGRNNIPVMFCPLIDVPFASNIVGEENVEYLWKDNSMTDMSLNELIKVSQNVAWNLVASKDLLAGEVVRTEIFLLP